MLRKAIIKPLLCATLFMWILLTAAKSLATGVQLAQTYHKGVVVSQYWISEKLDGIRARWDGHNLVTRNGHPIYAPDWFTQDFPAQMMDGELWIGRQQFEAVSSTVLDLQPGDSWHSVRFMVFDLPEHGGSFSQRVAAMRDLQEQHVSEFLVMIEQFRIGSEQALIQLLERLVREGAEGLMLHHQDAQYSDGRSDQLLKLKTYADAEARVIGHLPGKGKYQNMLGALLVETDDGRQFKLGSGFTDEQRRHPPALGATVTYKYYGLTKNGLPRFASFLRLRESE